jgi:hypothetical protein
MTGFEYTAAVGLIYEAGEDPSLMEAGLRVIANIRDRYDGDRRNPFDEAECGHHYARAMASWAAVLALSGFQYSAVSKTLTVGQVPGRYFWSTGYAWGQFEISAGTAATRTCRIAVTEGVLAVSRVALRGGASTPVNPARSLKAGEGLTIQL